MGVTKRQQTISSIFSSCSVFTTREGKLYLCVNMEGYFLCFQEDPSSPPAILFWPYLGEQSSRTEAEGLSALSSHSTPINNYRFQIDLLATPERKLYTKHFIKTVYDLLSCRSPFSRRDWWYGSSNLKQRHKSIHASLVHNATSLGREQWCHKRIPSKSCYIQAAPYTLLYEDKISVAVPFLCLQITCYGKSARSIVPSWSTFLTLDYPSILF